MKKIIFVFIILMAKATFAAELVIFCKDDGMGLTANIQYRPFRAGQYEALMMEYAGNNVLKENLSIFNHMGLIDFRGKNGIQFHTFEYSNEFYVTVPTFGGTSLITARGHCKIGG